GDALEEEDALDHAVGVLHLVDRLVVLLLLEPLVAPVPAHARVQEVLVDRGELRGEDLVERLDDLRIAAHACPSFVSAPWSARLAGTRTNRDARGARRAREGKRGSARSDRGAHGAAREADAPISAWR